LVPLLEPIPTSEPKTLSAKVLIVEATGSMSGLAGQSAEIAYQAPDKLRLSTTIERHPISLGRLGQAIWLYSPEKQFGALGKTGVARFSAMPDSLDTNSLPPFKLPLPREQLLLAPLLMLAESLPAETVDGQACHVVKATPQPAAMQVYKVPAIELTVWIRDADQLPARLKLKHPRGTSLTLELQGLKVEAPWPDKAWQLTAPAGARIETVALSHLTRFLPAAYSVFTAKAPTLPPSTGARKLLASEGNGWLEDYDGTRVLHLQGTPEEMGRQHGVLMKPQIRDLVNKVVYGVGVGSSFEKGRWFFGEIEEAQRRLHPFLDPRHLREMDALADASGLERQEVRLANVFPELFHCSGFAVYGKSTLGGRMYHGRILDYMRGVGLEGNAVVIVHRPEQGHAWVNVGYAGLSGTVTAMNEQHISIGEMGGRGEGNWDGKPMAQLLREVMEKASTLDEAVAILQRGPRTCEYFYVVADGRAKRAVGIAATPETFEVIAAGQSHPRLPHAIADAVVLSAGDRYEKLAARVREQHGKLDEEGARRLMDRPVCMKSNIHSVLFAPDTLDFWVANADAENEASHTRYTRYNLAALLQGPPPQPPASASR
jgi:outer membrane lipoprotein-sorting protein